MKVRSIAAAAIGVLAIVSLWLIVELADPDGTPESWLLLKLFHPGPQYFELTADFEVEGQPISIARTIECKPAFDRSQASVFGLSPSWHQARFLVSERVADGSGVMVVVPRACNRRELPGARFVPLILLVESVERPVRIEAFFDRKGLTEGKYRVRLLQFRLDRSQASQTSEQPESDFADWSNLYSKEASPSGQSRRFVSLVAISIPQSDASPELSKLREMHFSPSPIQVPAHQAGSAGEVIDEMNRAASGYYEAVSVPEHMMQRLIPFEPLGRSGFYKLSPEHTGRTYFVPEDLSRCDEVGSYCIEVGLDDLRLDHLPSHYVLSDNTIFYQFRFSASFIFHSGKEAE